MGTIQDYQALLITKYHNMIWKQVRSFHKTTGIDPDELYAEVLVECCSAMQFYDPARASLSTYLYRVIPSRLKSIVVRIQKREQYEAAYDVEEELFTNILDHSQDPSRQAEINVSKELLSEDARILIQKVLSKPYLYIGKDISKILKKRGWSPKRIATVLNEIRSVLF